jgi:hypothetical protein
VSVDYFKVFSSALFFLIADGFGWFKTSDDVKLV